MTVHRYLARRGYPSFPSALLHDVELIVDDDRVVCFGPAAPHRDVLPSTDLGDVVLIPGFIDAHVHLNFDGSDDPIATVKAIGDIELADLSARNAALLQAAGVTTARDLGSRGVNLVALRDDIAAGDRPGPRLLTAGSPVTSVGGHVWYLGGESVDADAMVALVRAQAAAGADCVKLVVSGGFLTDEGTVPVPQFDADQLKRVVDVAAELGLTVAAHAHSTQAVEAAAIAGVTTIEHATFIGAHGIDFRDDIVETMIANGVAVCPTVNSATGSYPDEYGRLAVERLRRMHDAGVRVLMGTDAGVRRVTGDHFAVGLEVLVDGGFTPEQVLGFATTAAADILHLPDTGRLVPGARADVVALSDDPVADIRATRSPAWVLSAGRVSHAVQKSVP